MGQAGHPLRTVYTAVLVDLAAFGVILPSLPYFAAGMGATGLWLGGLLSAYSVAKLVGAAFIGRLSDRHGRRPLMLISLGGSSLALLLISRADSLTMLAVTLGFAGLLSGSIATAQAFIADVTPPEQRARAMGLLGAAVASGFILGPAIGVGLARFGFRTAVLTGAGLAATNLLFATLRIGESLPADDALSGRWLSFGRLLACLREPLLVRLLLASYLSTFAFVGMEATFAYLGSLRYGLTERGFGMVLVYVGILIIVVQGGFIGRLTLRFGEHRLAVLGGLLLALALVLIPGSPSLVWALVPLGLLAIGRGLLTPSLSALLSRNTRRQEQGGILGLGQAMAAAARATGPLIAGWLYDLEPSRPYLVCGVLALLAALSVAASKFQGRREPRSL